MAATGITVADGDHAWIDVRFDTAGVALDEASILDDADEFTLTGATLISNMAKLLFEP